MKTNPDPLLAEWFAERANQAVYLKRGQVLALLRAVGVGEGKVDDLWPTGCEAKKHLPRVRHALYVRRCVLADLGVSDYTR